MPRFHAAVLLAMALYTLARSAFGLLGSTRRVTFDNTMLFWHYTCAQGVVAQFLLHLFPRLAE